MLADIRKILEEFNTTADAKRNPERSPLQRALSLLVRREHSCKELTQKLCARGIPSAEIDRAIEHLTKEGLQSDERFAESLARTRTGAGYGMLRIRAELAAHDVDKAVIDAVLTGYEGEWIQIAGNLLRRRFRPDGPVTPVQRRKAADLLIRRGFDGDTVRMALRTQRSD